MNTRFRKKPVVIEAIQLPELEEENSLEVEDWLEKRMDKWESDGYGGIIIYTLEGNMRADPGDWIIEGIQGELYPCKPDIFKQTYEPE